MKKKYLYKNLVYNVIGYVLPAFILFFSTPIIVSKMGTELYGVYILLVTFLGFMSFMDLGIGQGMLKFLPELYAKNDFWKINDVISVSLFVSLILGVLGATVIFFTAPLILSILNVNKDFYSEALRSFNLISLGFLVMMFNSVISNIPRALQRYDVVVILQNSILVLNTLTVILLLHFGYGLFYMVLSYVVYQFLGTIFLANYNNRLLVELKYSIKFRYETFKKIINFSIFIAINNITGNIVFRVDKMIISYFLGPSAVSYYQVVFNVIQYAFGLVTYVIQFLFPYVSYISSFESKEKLRKIYYRTLYYVSGISLLISFCIIFFGKFGLKMWMGEEFSSNVPSEVIILIAFTLMIVTISNVSYFFFNGLGKSHINMISSFIGASSYLLASYIFIPKYSLIGAAVAFLFILVPVPYYAYSSGKLILNR